MIKLNNYLIFSVASVPPLIVSQTFPALQEDCKFFGAFGYWFPVCATYEIPDCSDVYECSNHGICVSKNQCLCLPSWTGIDCGSKIPNFQPVASNKRITEYLPILSLITWIEVFAFVQLFIYLSGALRSSWSTSLKKLLATSWMEVLESHRIWTFLTFLFYHDQVLHMLNNLYGFYVYAPFIFSELGSWRFLVFFVFTSIIVASLSLSVSRYQHRVNLIYGFSGHVIALKTLFILYSSGWNDHYIRSLIHLFLSQILLDYVFLGDRLDITLHIGGLIAGCLFYSIK